MKKVHIFVSGNVQGVFFRRFVEELAQKLELNGWVRNRRGGEVEIVAEGKDTILNRFVRELWYGPGKVENVKSRYEDYVGDLRGFKRLETV